VFDYDTQLKSTAESSDTNQTYMLSDGNIPLSVPNVSVTLTYCSSQNVIGIKASGVHDTSTKCDADIRENLYVMLLGGTTMFQRIVERMTEELTVLSPSTMRSRWLLHLCKSTQYELEGLPFSSQHIPADVNLEDEYNDLARPSFIGRASVPFLTCCISEQQCCMEIDSVSSFTD